MSSSWFPFFGRDFIAATAGWTAEERGHYVALLIVQWEQDGLPDDVKRLELISPGIKGCWETVSEKFPVWKDGKRRNTRLEHERSKSHDRSERARQSASQRWAATAKPDGDAADAPKPPADDGSCERICERTCDGICDGICVPDAPMSMSYTPPPPAVADASKAGWPSLREAWNHEAKAGKRDPWRSAEPPDGALERLGEPGWIDEAMQAIPMLAGLGAFTSPVTLGQFCQKGWVAKVLGGYWREKRRQRPQRCAGDLNDRPPPPEPDPAFEAAKRATEARERSRREAEHRRLDEQARRRQAAGGAA